MTRKRTGNAPCDCNAVIINKGTTVDGRFRVKCSVCQRNWKQTERPPRQTHRCRRPRQEPCSCGAPLRSNGKVGDRIMVKCTACNRGFEVAEKPPRLKPKRAEVPMARKTPQIRNRRLIEGIDFEPRVVVKIDELVLAPDVAQRYLKVRQTYVAAGLGLCSKITSCAEMQRVARELSGSP